MPAEGEEIAALEAHGRKSETDGEKMRTEAKAAQETAIESIGSIVEEKKDEEVAASDSYEKKNGLGANEQRRRSSARPKRSFKRLSSSDEKKVNLDSSTIVERLVHFLGFFPQISSEIQCFNNFIPDVKIDSSPEVGRAKILKETDPSGRFTTYYAWCFIFRETLIEHRVKLANELVMWLNDFNRTFPLTGVQAVVEQIRLYLSLRSGFQSRILSKQRQMDALEIIERLPIGPLLPYMQSSLDSSEFDLVVNKVFGVEPIQLYQMIISNSQTEEAEPPGTTPSPLHDIPTIGIDDTAATLWENRPLDGYCSDDDVEEDEDEDDDDDEDNQDFKSKDTMGALGASQRKLHVNVQSRQGSSDSVQDLSGIMKAAGKTSSAKWSSQRHLRKIGSFASSVSSAAQSRNMVCERYGYFGTLETAELLRIMAFQDQFSPLGTFDKKCILLSFKNRHTRSETFTAFINYLFELERTSAVVVSLESRFLSTMRTLSRHSRSFPPSLGIAQSAYVAAVKLATLASEFNYEQGLKTGMNELVEETKDVMLIAFDSARVTQHLGSVSYYRGGSGIQRLSSSGSMTHSFINTQNSSTFSLNKDGANSVNFDEENRSAQASSNAINPVGSNPPASNTRDGPNAKVYDSSFFNSAPPNTQIAEIPGCWLQIDPTVEATSRNTPDVVSEEEMTSMYPGKVRIFKNKITWTMVQPVGTVQDKAKEKDRDDNHREFLMEDAAGSRKSSVFGEVVREGFGSLSLSIYNAETNQYGVSECFLTEAHAENQAHGVRADQEPFMRGTISELTKPISLQHFRKMHRTQDGGTMSSFGNPNNNRGSKSSGTPSFSGNNSQEISESLFSIPLSTIGRYSWGMLDSSNTYLAIYTTEVVKLFPFCKSEMQEIVKALHELTGLKPTTVGAQNEDAFKQKLEDVRLRILDENILEKKTKWISHTEELLRVLRELTKDDSPIKMVEMERLYHSCRNNKAVVFESMSILKELWSQAKTQDIMMKILAIVDRFLDGDILNGDDEILSDTLAWLHTIETTLDPYSNATPLKLLLRICHRAESLQSQTIIPLVEIFYDDNIFDLRDVMRKYLQTHESANIS